MVKKTYTKPTMDEIKVEGINLMAGSPTCPSVTHGGSSSSECNTYVSDDDAKSGQFDFGNTASEDFDK